MPTKFKSHRELVERYPKFGSKLYQTWRGIRRRCLDKNHKDYHRYGARGIDIDPRWHNFDIFAADVGEPPSDDFSIERKDNSRGYWPDNVTWATIEEQSNNRRSNVIIEYCGESMTIAQWARRIGVGMTTLHARLQTMTVDQALTKPKRKYRGK